MLRVELKPRTKSLQPRSRFRGVGAQVLIRGLPCSIEVTAQAAKGGNAYDGDDVVDDDDDGDDDGDDCYSECYYCYRLFCYYA